MSPLRDPRVLQIAILSGLLAYGALALDLEVRPGHALAALAGTIATEAALVRARLRPRFDVRSPLISGLSLCLLLRAVSWPWMLLAGVLAIGSKAAVRWNGRHVFNPTNVAIVALWALTDRVWVSPGQWGSAALGALALAGLGAAVGRRASRSDVPVAFLAAYAAALFARAAWLGDPWAIPLHQLESGTLLVFAFFMISDPRTTPARRSARILFCVAVAALGAWGRFALHEPAALLPALALCSPFVPLLDRWWPAPAYTWPGAAPAAPTPKGESHATSGPRSDAHASGPRPAGAGAGLLRLLRGARPGRPLQPQLARGDRP